MVNKNLEIGTVVFLNKLTKKSAKRGGFFS